MSVAETRGQGGGFASALSARGDPAQLEQLARLKARARRTGEASFFYLDHHFQFPAVKVLPGEHFVSSENLIIMTVLPKFKPTILTGMMVSVCTYFTRFCETFVHHEDIRSTCMSFCD